MRKRMSMILVIMMMATVAAGCGKSDETGFNTSDVYAEQTETKSSEKETSENDTSESDSSADNSDDMFTERDMAQEADLSEAETLAVKDGEDLTITSEGVYVLSGSSKDTTVANTVLS